MQFLTNLLTAVATTEPAAEAAPELFFQPLNFFKNLQYMGIGMLVIFLVIGIIIVATNVVNKMFSESE